MKYFKKLVGQKCYLSPVNPEDVETFTGWLNDLEVTRNLGLAAQNISLVNEKAALERLAKDGHTYAIVDLATDEMIGDLGLIDIDHVNARCGIGIFIGNKQYWGKGYGTEAMRLLLQYAFEYLNLHSAWLNVYEFNERARACYRKVGFKEIGRRREAVFRDGRYHDDIYMDMLAREFREQNKPTEQGSRS